MDSNVENVINLIRAREQKGLTKYGRTTDSGYSRAEMLQHLLEELLDASIYTSELLRQENATSKLLPARNPCGPKEPTPKVLSRGSFAYYDPQADSEWL